MNDTTGRQVSRRIGNRGRRDRSRIVSSGSRGRSRGRGRSGRSRRATAAAAGGDFNAAGRSDRTAGSLALADREERSQQAAAATLGLAAAGGLATAVRSNFATAGRSGDRNFAAAGRRASRLAATTRLQAVVQLGEDAFTAALGFAAAAGLASANRSGINHDAALRSNNRLAALRLDELRLAAARGAAIRFASAAVSAEHAIQQIVGVALATQPESKHQRTNHHLDLH